jgi:undecaprenyl-diphosphatase
MSIDLAILKFFNITLSSGFFDKFFIIICDFDIWRWPLVLILVALLWKGGPKGRWLSLLIVIAVGIIDPTISQILKPGVGRLRPCHNPALDWVLTPDGCGGRYGFPSSHAANFFGLAIVVGLFYRRLLIPLLIIAGLVGIGRIYLGVHFPSDVLFGSIYGASIGSAIVLAAIKIAPNRIGRFFTNISNSGKE